MKRLFILCYNIIFIVILFNSTVSAQEKIFVGVAANYIQVFKELSQNFEKKTGIKIEATYTSSGHLYSQIVNGAPYDMFLSADEKRPFLLFKKDIAYKPFVYAKGKLFIWSSCKDLCKQGSWKEPLKTNSIKKISIANPEIAPYGSAAKTALKKIGYWDLVESKIVYSQTVAQAFHYASIGAVDAGFCAPSAVYSEKGKKGCYYSIEEAPLIIQSACVLKRSKKLKLLNKFVSFIVSDKANKIKNKFGYQ